jgi:peroxiredoxin
MALAGRLDLGFPLLVDPAANVVREYGIFNLLGDGLATASTFILDKQGRITYRYVGKGISDRPPTDLVINALQETQSS